MDLSILPERLDMTASRLWKTGEPCTTPKGRLLVGNRKSSYCCIKFADNTEATLSETLTAALRILDPHAAFLNELAEKGACLHFSIGWFSDDLNSGERLEWSLLLALANLKISLNFDFYGPQETATVT